PLLVHAQKVEYLTGGRSEPIGAAITPRRLSAEVIVPVDSLLIWYSDGLIERRDEDLDTGLARLAAAAAGLPLPRTREWAGPQAWTETLLHEMTAGRRIEDDIAVICLLLGRENLGCSSPTCAEAPPERNRDL